MLQPKTLEEALAVIAQRDAQVADLTTKNQTILNEKRDLVEKMFSDKDKEGMTDTERKLAEALELSTSTVKQLEAKIESDNKARQDADNTRVSTALETRIKAAAKGDAAVEEKLRANVALLDKMPRTNDAEFDAVITAGWNMLGTKEANPLATTNNTTGGTPPVDTKTNFAETAEGKGLAGKLGLTNVAKAGEAEAAK
jgi:hypothetical protein